MSTSTTTIDTTSGGTDDGGSGDDAHDAHGSGDHDGAATTSPRTITAVGALVGVACAALALGVAELIAGIVATWRSPIFSVGERVIDLAPSFVTKFAIEVFGTNDKTALLVGIGVVLALYAAVVGALAFRRSAVIGAVGFVLFGLIGIAAVLTSSSSTGLAATTPIVVGTVLGAAAITAAARALVDRRGEAGTTTVHPDTGATDRADADPDDDQRPWLPRPAGTRRQFFAGAGTAVGVFALAGGVTGAIGRTIRSRFSATESRDSLRLPRPASPLAPAPAGVDVGVDGIAPFFTPNADFYRIDTALSVPQVRAEDHRLRVTGMVDRELDLSFDELLRREVVEYDITMTCVSNVVGGGLVGNARWLGVRLDDLLRDAGISPDADQIIGRSVDGYTCGFPVEAATDGRDAIVAFGMNGEPLPLEHGFPLRLVVPGLYGYVSATKWLSEIEVTTFEDVTQYWVPRGYADRAPIKIQSRIDSVSGFGTLEPAEDGTVAVGGVAWAQTRGISAVQVRVGDGDWQEAELGDALNDDTWRQWAYRWTPDSTGRTTVTTRAVDGDGEVQPETRSDPLPDGASGWHSVSVTIA